ncbi:MAG: MFS transporter [SAR202 cluster bacterium]|nr:MFS transporter [SAR202 cluster bacterium]
MADLFRQCSATVIRYPMSFKPHSFWPGPRPHLPDGRHRFQVHTFDSLAIRDFRLILMNSLLVNAGKWVHGVVVGWLTFNLTQSPFITALAVGLDLLPVLFIGPFAGVFLDAFDRRKTLAIFCAFQALSMLVFRFVIIMGAATAAGVLIYAVMNGTARVVIDPGRTALLASTVPANRIVNSFAMNSIVANFTRMIMPALAGVLIAFAGAGWTLLLGAGILAAAAVFSWAMRPQVAGLQKLQRNSLLSKSVEGAKYAMKQRPVLAVLLLSTISTLLVLPFVQGLMPVFAEEVHHVDAQGLGLMVAALGAGPFIASFALASANFKRPGRASIIFSVLLALGTIWFDFSPTFIMALVALTVYASFHTSFNVVNSASLQALIPDDLRGRVLSFAGMIGGAQALGAIGAGALAEWIGAPHATAAAAACVLVFLALFVIRFPEIWKLK